MIFYSFPGGDDCILNAFDVRVGTDAVKKNSKTHSSGVTSLASGLPSPNHLMTGSYDEHLRLFDKRAFNRPIQEIDLKGGIWRIKLNPVDLNLILCACMYHNFSIVQYSFESGFLLDAEIEHGKDKICYGADWGRQKGPALSKSYKFATCSFYDKLFSLNAYHQQ